MFLYSFRHFALRLWRVRDNAERLGFVSTTLMKADGLTKIDASTTQRKLLLNHVIHPIEDEDEKEDEENPKSNTVNVDGYFVDGDHYYLTTFPVIVKESDQFNFYDD